jgi:hypothetical protein
MGEDAPALHKRVPGAAVPAWRWREEVGSLIRIASKQALNFAKRCNRIIATVVEKDKEDYFSADVFTMCFAGLKSRAF